MVKKDGLKVFFCDSSWELAFVVYHIENKLNIKRCDVKYKYIIENTEHIYTPDFITDEGIIEIKGRRDYKAKIKEEKFPNVIVIDKTKISTYLDYVINKYGDEFWKTLYD